VQDVVWQNGPRLAVSFRWPAFSVTTHLRLAGVTAGVQAVKADGRLVLVPRRGCAARDVLEEGRPDVAVGIDNVRKVVGAVAAENVLHSDAGLASCTLNCLHGQRLDGRVRRVVRADARRRRRVGEEAACVGALAPPRDFGGVDRRRVSAP